MEIKEYSKVEAGLSELAEQFGTVPDVSTEDGFKLCKSNAKEVAAVRIALEAKRKELKTPALELSRSIDSEAKRIQKKIALIEDPLKLAYKEEEERIKKTEQDRIDSIRGRIDAINAFDVMADKADSTEISEYIEMVDEIDCSEGFFEFTKEALLTKKRVCESLAVKLVNRIEFERLEEERERQAAELEKEREQIRTERAELERLKNEVRTEAAKNEPLEKAPESKEECSPKDEKNNRFVDLKNLTAMSMEIEFLGDKYSVSANASIVSVGESKSVKIKEAYIEDVRIDKIWNQNFNQSVMDGIVKTLEEEGELLEVKSN